MTARSRARIALVAYGVLCALAGSLYLNAVSPREWLTMGRRVNDFKAELVVLKEGGPPLLGRNPALVGAPTAPAGCPSIPFADSHGYYVTGGVESLGSYLYVPYLARAFHTHDVRDGLRVLYLLLFAVALLSYPLMFYELFGSAVAALIAPVVLAVGVGRLAYTDLYWISAWTMLALTPPVLLAVKRWSRRSGALLIGAVVGASFAESIRVGVGGPILVTSVLAVVLGVRRWAHRGALVLALVVAYVSVAPIGMMAVTAYRNHRMAHMGIHGIWLGSSDAWRTRPAWHNPYIGLGYLPNRYRLHYRDEIGVRDASRRYRCVDLSTAQYDHEVRRLYLGLVRRDPGFVAGVTVRKAVVMLGHQWWALIFCALVAAPSTLFGSQRRLFGRYLMVVSVIIALSAAAPVLVAPYIEYEQGVRGALFMLVLVCFGWLVGPGRPRELLRAPQRPSRGAITGAAAVASCVILAATLGAVYGPHIEGRARSWEVRAPD